MTASETARRRFHAIVLPHLDDAYALARYLCGNGADAEDIVQDACLRALAALETHAVEQPRAWLLTIVRNVALSFLARNNPRQRRETDIGDLENEGRLPFSGQFRTECLPGNLRLANRNRPELV